MKKHLFSGPARSGFSLFEVVLAVGVLAVSILALLGLFGPTMSSVRDVVDSNEASSVRTRLHASLMSGEIYDRIGLPHDGFETFGNLLPAPGSGDPYVLYFWQSRQDNESPLELEFGADPPTLADMEISEGQSFVVTLEQGMQTQGDDAYDFSAIEEEGFFPILVSIYALPIGEMVALENVADFVEANEPIVTYPTAKLR